MAIGVEIHQLYQTSRDSRNMQSVKLSCDTACQAIDAISLSETCVLINYCIYHHQWPFPCHEIASAWSFKWNLSLRRNAGAWLKNRNWNIPSSEARCREKPNSTQCSTNISFQSIDFHFFFSTFFLHFLSLSVWRLSKILLLSLTCLVYRYTITDYFVFISIRNDGWGKLKSARKEICVKETQWHSPLKSPCCGIFCPLWLQEFLLKRQNFKKRRFNHYLRLLLLW